MMIVKEGDKALSTGTSAALTLEHSMHTELSWKKKVQDKSIL